MRGIRAVCVVLGVAAGTAQAADAPPTSYIRAGRVLDVESGRLLQNQIIAIAGDRIQSIGAADAAPPPAGAAVVDLGGYTVLPGLFDAHAHLMNNADEHGYRGLANSVPRQTVIGVKNARLTLLAGFTSARMLGAEGFSDIALRDGINAGDVVGPRLTVSGPQIGITGGHCASNNLLPPEYSMMHEEGVADGPWEVRYQVRRNIKYGADVIKTCSTGGVLSKGTKVGAPQYTVEELTAMFAEAHSHGLKATAHAHGAEGIRNAIVAGADSIEHASFIDDEGIRLARQRGVTLVMDIYNTEYIIGEGEKAGILPESIAKERITGQTQRDNFRKAHAAGVNIVFGTDAGVYPHGQNARQFRVMVEYGMTPLQAIQAATVKAARLFGTEADAGTLTPGKYADVIAVAGNPLEDVRLLEDVRFVMKGGAIYKQD